MFPTDNSCPHRAEITNRTLTGYEHSHDQLGRVKTEVNI